MDEREQQELQTLLRSRYWKWTQAYLLARREALFQHESKSTEDLWRREGALQEVNRLLRAPQLVLEWYRKQKKPSDLGNEYIADGEAGATAMPHGPALFE